MPTISMSGKFCVAARNTMRPMRPNPLIPTLIAILPDLWNLLLQYSLSDLHDVVRREAEMLEEIFRDAGRTERRHADDITVRPDVAPPCIRRSGFDRDTA